MKLTKLIPLILIPLFLVGCENKANNSSSQEQEQSLISLAHTNISLPEDKTFQLTVTVDDSLKDMFFF